MDDDWEYADCPVCESSDAKYCTCWSCGGEGGWCPYESDPLWYDPNDFEVCDICHGNGGYWVCPNCSAAKE